MNEAASTTVDSKPTVKQPESTSWRVIITALCIGALLATALILGSGAAKNAVETAAVPDSAVIQKVEMVNCMAEVGKKWWLFGAPILKIRSDSVDGNINLQTGTIDLSVNDGDYSADIEGKILLSKVYQVGQKYFEFHGDGFKGNATIGDEGSAIVHMKVQLEAATKL